MKYEKEIKNINGDRVTIIISCTSGILDNSSDIFSLDDLMVIKKGKKKGVFICGALTNNYEYRSLRGEERKKYRLNKMLEYVTLDDLNLALIEAWESTKPKLISLE